PRRPSRCRCCGQASYSWLTSSATSPSSSKARVIRFGRQQTAQSSVKVWRRPPLGSVKTSLSSPQNAQAYVTTAASSAPAGEALEAGVELDAERVERHRHQVVLADREDQIHELLGAVPRGQGRPGGRGHEGVVAQLVGGPDERGLERIPARR